MQFVAPVQMNPEVIHAAFHKLAINQCLRLCVGFVAFGGVEPTSIETSDSIADMTV
jgi:hypothetical protein